MILSVGEILADMIGTEKDGSLFFERKAGGAPLNVACAAKKLGADVAFVGCVGDDLIGKYLQKYAEEKLGGGAMISVLPDRNTTLAFVQLDKNGERSFCFYRKNTADIFLPEIDDALLSASSILHIGSLMLSDKRGFRYAQKLALRARNAGIKVSFDINYRSDIFKDEKAAMAAYRGLVELADIVKFSEDELEIFSESYVYGLKGKLVLISLGEKGSEWRLGDRGGKVGAPNVTPIDTTGAGDAFLGGVLATLDGKEWTDDVIESALKVGNVAGALNTLSRGAIDGLPDMDEVKKYL